MIMKAEKCPEGSEAITCIMTLYAPDFAPRTVVYLLIPTSNHHGWSAWSINRFVVYLLIPTSNHNGDIFAYL